MRVSNGLMIKLLGSTGTALVAGLLLGGVALADTSSPADITSASQTVSNHTATSVTTSGGDQAVTTQADVHITSSTDQTDKSLSQASSNSIAIDHPTVATPVDPMEQADDDAASVVPADQSLPQTAQPATSVVTAGGSMVPQAMTRALLARAEWIPGPLAAAKAIQPVVTAVVPPVGPTSSPAPIRASGVLTKFFAGLLIPLLVPIAPAALLATGWTLFILGFGVILWRQAGRRHLTYAGLLQRMGYAHAARSDAGARQMIPLLVGYSGYCFTR